MRTQIKIDSLTLIGSRKNYSVRFKDGFNLISGPTSTGKTSILEMIDYALGAKSHKSYIEIGNSCSQVELVLYIGKEKYLIRRQLFNFTAPVIVEDWSEENKTYARDHCIGFSRTSSSTNYHVLFWICMFYEVLLGIKLTMFT